MTKSSASSIFKVIVGGILFCISSVSCGINFNDIDNNNRNFQSVPTTVKTYENDTVLLPCYHNSPFRYVTWHRDEVLLVDSRHPEIPPPERYHLWGNGSLQVSHVKAEDTGDYYCEIMTSGGHAQQVHAIEVQYPPTVISSLNGIMEVPIGSVFEIVCDTKGVPLPIITWRQPGIEMDTEKLENKRRLVIEVNSKEMSGPIECIATNGVGEPAVAGIHLNVLFKPEVKTSVNAVHTKINMRAHLECLVIAAPSATVHWFHHGVPVLTDNRIARRDTVIQANRSLTNYITESNHVLVIKKVKDHDLGMYECRAENRLGFKGGVIELTGRPMPCIFKISPMISTASTHNIIWQTESLSPIIEHKLKFRQIPAGTVTPQSHLINIAWNELTIPAEFSEGPIHTIGYTLRGLQPASVYEVAVISRNRYGWSENSKIVRFATGGEIELPNYSTEFNSELQYDEIQDNFLTDYTPPNLSESQSGHRNSGSHEFNLFSNSFKICISFVILIIFLK